MSIKIKRTGKGWTDKLLNRLQACSKVETVVGFPRGKNLAQPFYPNGASVLDVAIWNNYGTDTIPRRAFMENASKDLIKLVKEKRKEHQPLINEGKMDPMKSGKILGLLAIVVVRESIRNGTYVPNSPMTIRAKGSSKPLIDTGAMMQHVDSDTREK